MPSGFLAAALDEQRTAARQILEGFASRAQEAGIAVDTEIQEAAVNANGQTLGAFARYFDLAVKSLSPIRMPSPNGRAQSKQRYLPRAGLCWSSPTFTRPRSNWSMFWLPGTEAPRQRVHSGTHCHC